MLKRLSIGYSDFLSLNWLFRLRAPYRGWLIGIVFLCVWFAFGEEGVKSVLPGAIALTKNGLPMSREMTIAWGTTSLLVSMVAFLIALCLICRFNPFERFYPISLLRSPLSFFRFLRQYRRSGDVWLSTSCAAAPQLLGLGSNRSFNWYLTGSSQIYVQNLDGVFDFLRSCEYMSDEDQFESWDFWQHPTEFETRRRGDCEDHALWAWRKLNVLGLKADFVIGRWRTDTKLETDKGHAWVVFHHKGNVLLMESTAKSQKLMFQPLDSVQDRYIPHFSVGSDCRIRVYGGYIKARDNRNRPAVDPNFSDLTKSRVQ